MRSQSSRQEPDQRGEDRTVGPVQPGRGIGAAQHGDLMPQHEQLGVLGSGRPAKQDQPATLNRPIVTRLKSGQIDVDWPVKRRYPGPEAGPTSDWPDNRRAGRR